MPTPVPTLLMLLLSLGLSGCTLETHETVQHGGTAPGPVAESNPGPPHAFGGGAIMADLPSNITVTVARFGDAFVVLAQAEGRTVLYDTGDSNTTSSLADWLQRLGVNQVDLLFVSDHATRHAGGCPGLAQALPVALAFLPTGAASCREALDAASMQVRDSDSLTVGQVLRASPHISVQILAVETLALRLDYGAFSAILAADASCDLRTRILQAGNVQAEVLDLGLPCTTWPDAVHPSYAFVAGGVEDRHDVASLEQEGTRVDRLEDGDQISYQSDGSGVTLSTSSSGSIGFAA